MAYTAIPDADIDAESPLKTTNVFTRLRDNIVALYEDTRASAYKTAQEDIVGSTVLQDDNHLSWTVGTNEVWVANLSLLVTTSDAAGDLKIQITTPGGGSTGHVIALAYDGGASLIGDAAIDAPLAIAYSAARTADPLFVTAHITTVTAGTVKLQWAQNAASGTTSLLAGSYLDAFRTDPL